uniref:UBP-type domain-containing protein n=1 Tax=Eucampia antarctica TaxID=49252 RepID=A0A7S2RNR0_9STRA|mmetsp:Transcript_24754/g.23782  ORF Transcript_24754/g.23782 Transcript_24754/m.23782 type:complete len:260 (+) Transcript_24754:3-782(+)
MNDDDDNVKKSEMMKKERLRAANNAIMMKTLVDEYRFSRYAVVKALDALGNDSDHDVMEVCNYILDNDLGQDCGGSVMPITNCPHIEQQAALQVTKTTTTTPPLSIFSMDGNNNNEKQIRSPVVVWDKVNVCTYWKDKKGSNEASSLRKCNDNDNDDDEDDNESGGCGGEGENWLCLECNSTNCSRYVNGHGLVHWQETCRESEDGVGHCVAVSMGDFSVWCYICNSYLKHPKLYPILEQLHASKFPNDKQPSLPTVSE